MSASSDAEKSKRIEQTFDEFNESWLVYWNAYIDLQNQLYESLKSAREVTWLGATDYAKMSEINAAQRQLFATMPRRLDYAPLGQINRSMDYALSKINELLTALFSEIVSTPHSTNRSIREVRVETRRRLIEDTFLLVLALPAVSL